MSLRAQLKLNAAMARMLKATTSPALQSLGTALDDEPILSREDAVRAVVRVVAEHPGIRREIEAFAADAERLAAEAIEGIGRTKP